MGCVGFADLKPVRSFPCRYICNGHFCNLGGEKHTVVIVVWKINISARI